MKNFLAQGLIDVTKPRGFPCLDRGKRGPKERTFNTPGELPIQRFRFLYFLCFFCFLCIPLHAEHTRRWRQSTYEEFLKGTAHGVAVRSDGRLELAPKFTLLADADASYLWSVKLDPKGTLYAAGGSPSKVFRFDSSGKPSVVFDSTDLSAQAIAFDSKGALYVGTSPDGKVYRVSSAGEKAVFFDPKTKYIWDLAFSPDGTLYVATGDKGQIFAVAPDGKGELFYSSDEAHIRVLAFDARGDVIAGTEPSGRILRVSRGLAKTASKGSKDSAPPGTEGFVLYETSKREVTSLAVSGDGRREPPRSPPLAESAPDKRSRSNLSPRFLRFSPAPSIALARTALPKSCGVRARTSFTRWASLPMAGSLPVPATTARFLRSTDEAFSRSLPKRVPRKSPELPVTRPAKSSCAPPIPENFFLPAPKTKPKARTNPVPLTRSFFPSGAAWNGGALRQLLHPNPPARRATRGSNSSCAREIRKIREESGRAGTARTPNPVLRWKRPPRASRSGKR